VSYQDFRNRLPVTQAEDMKPFLVRIEQGEAHVLWPGSPKQILSSFQDARIPVSGQLINEVFTRGIHDMYLFHLRNNPHSRLFSGYFVNVGNDGEPPFIDQLDYFLKENEPFLHSLLNIPRQLDLQQLPNVRMKQLVKEIGTANVACFKGSPLALSRFLNYLKESNWPLESLYQAEILFHKTTQPSKQLTELKQHLALSVPVQSIYATPEGLFGIQDDPSQDNFLLMIDLSSFYEFLQPGTSEPIPLEDVRPGIDYHFVISNCSGLWRYRSNGPKIRFVSCNPFRFERVS
jgi:hypothetical protein